MRLDVYLAESGLAASRSEAKALITEGLVFVGDKPIDKPSYDVSGVCEQVAVRRACDRYVSRGGLKLKAAIDAFGINCENRLCLDVGASSGGFTDCLLKHGAARVIAVDSGHGQLVKSVRDDVRVLCIESYNARYASLLNSLNGYYEMISENRQELAPSIYGEEAAPELEGYEEVEEAVEE